MPSTEKGTFTLPTEEAGYIDALVAAVEEWLRKEVLGVYDAMQSDPGRAIPAKKVFATIGARHADRLKG